jgi:hypothetical protein
MVPVILQPDPCIVLSQHSDDATDRLELYMVLK